MALTLGTRLGTYEIVAPLGAGGMGEVYRARDHKLERDVAIKVLPETAATRSHVYRPEAELGETILPVLLTPPLPANENSPFGHDRRWVKSDGRLEPALPYQETRTAAKLAHVSGVPGPELL